MIKKSNITIKQVKKINHSSPGLQGYRETSTFFLFLISAVLSLCCNMQAFFSYIILILVPQAAVEPTPPALEGRLLTTGPSGKSHS